ncbi:unnamed protein product [Paramecium sonneborni]|uniref:Uncharacterized protein n=1 Tax=Paramecium sonneborni TaxID=65129 RepID=A0A8S1NQ90_9CILI|nr:unnamed protein product [Paramecium sonneborni]
MFSLNSIDNKNFLITIEQKLKKKFIQIREERTQYRNDYLKKGQVFYDNVDINSQVTPSVRNSTYQAFYYIKGKNLSNSIHIPNIKYDQFLGSHFRFVCCIRNEQNYLIKSLETQVSFIHLKQPYHYYFHIQKQLGGFLLSFSLFDQKERQMESKQIALIKKCYIKE